MYPLSILDTRTHVRIMSEDSDCGNNISSIHNAQQILGQRSYVDYSDPSDGLKNKKRSGYLVAPVNGYLPKRPGWDWRETDRYKDNGIQVSASYTLEQRSKAIWRARRNTFEQSSEMGIMDTIAQVHHN